MPDAEKPCEKVLTIKEVSDFLRIPVSTIYELVQKGTLPASRFGKHWRILQSDLIQYLHGSKILPAASSPRDKRQHPRLNTELWGHLVTELSREKDLHHRGMISNLSESGACFMVTHSSGGPETGEEVLSPGDPVHLYFEMPGEQVQVMEIEGRVVRSDSNGNKKIAVKFRSMKDRAREVIRHYVG